MVKSRVEAITDGIVAIAATIMVLELGIPSRNDWKGLQELRHTFLAYVISFMMIYTVWAMHHDLFHKAELISRKTFLVNGVWIFMLTLVPFTTAWVGSAPDAVVPEMLYPLNLLLWSIAFQWLDYQIRKDNPEVPRDDSTVLHVRVVLYGGYILSMILAFIKPILSISVIGLLTVVFFIWTFLNRK
ncbi:MAG: TMEM175 family protein [Eubacterium sp.]